MIKTGIIGATGYAGAELVRILSGHPEVIIQALTSRQYAGTGFDNVFPSMTGRVDLVCEKFSMESICAKTDVVFLALPHKLPMEIVPDLIKHGKKVIDLSADFRFNDPLLYELHYQPHTAKTLLKSAVYGLSEVYYDKIKEASLIGNPGCYPTSLLLPLIPLLKCNMIDTESIIADSKSGVSGAGRSPSLTTHFCEAGESFKAYKIGIHRHNPEMNEVLSMTAGKPVNITFVPHLVPIIRGMYTTIYATLKAGIKIDDIYNQVESFYDGRHFIRIRRGEINPDTLYVKGTNYCDIAYKIDSQNNRLIITSAIDNLIKGAAGQAVQNMNIMMGLDETTGLMNLPFPI